MKKSFPRAACLVFVAILMSPAHATIPDLDHSTVEWAYEGSETLSLMNLPNGQGFGFDHAFPPGDPVSGPADAVDATVTLTVIDGLMNPVANFPFEDLWLESQDGGMAFCPGGTVADQDTDAQGRTYFRSPLFAGGSSTTVIGVRVNGDWLGGRELPLWVNSPDLNGDLRVDLLDIGAFATGFFGSYVYRIDFNFDGVINLGDVRYLALGIGAQCP